MGGLGWLGGEGYSRVVSARLLDKYACLQSPGLHMKNRF